MGIRILTTKRGKNPLSKATGISLLEEIFQQLNQCMQNVLVCQQPSCVSSKQRLFLDFVSTAIGTAWDEGQKVTCNLVSPAPEARASPRQELRKFRQ